MRNHDVEASESHRLRWVALGVVLGASGFALLDPRRGAARRAMLRDKLASWRRHRAEEARRREIDAEQRARGAAYEARARREEGDVPDHQLEERVRAQLGRPVSHPRALHVRVTGGIVELSGPILAGEVDDLVRTVREVRGVRAVVNNLEVHRTPGNVPSLQGGPGAPQAR